MCRLTNKVCDSILPIIAVFVSHTHPLSIIGFHNLLGFSHSTSHSVSQWQSSLTLTQKKYLPFSEARNNIPSPLSCSTTQMGLPSIELARRFFALLDLGLTVTLFTKDLHFKFTNTSYKVSIVSCLCDRFDLTTDITFAFPYRRTSNRIYTIFGATIRTCYISILKLLDQCLFLLYTSLCHGFE